MGDKRPLGEGLLIEREKQGKMKELECSQGGSTEQRVLVRECVDHMRLLGHTDCIMMNDLMCP